MMVTVIKCEDDDDADHLLYAMQLVISNFQNLSEKHTHTRRDSVMRMRRLEPMMVHFKCEAPPRQLRSTNRDTGRMKSCSAGLRETKKWRNRIMTLLQVTLKLILLEEL